MKMVYVYVNICKKYIYIKICVVGIISVNVCIWGIYFFYG